MKLVIYHTAWPQFAPSIRAALRTPWNIVTGANDLAWLLREIADADALVALKLPPEARPHARRLRLLHFPGAGVMHSSPEELPAGCALANVYEHEIPIAEFVMMTILMHVTRVLEFSAAFRLGRWEGNGRMGGQTHAEAYGKTLGLIGYGHIGQTVAARARAFGMRVMAVDIAAPSGQAIRPDWFGSPAELDQMLAACDFLVIACPLTESTRGLLGARELARMPRHAMLINVSRAEVVEEKPLYEALCERRIAAAALDVWYQYPAGNDEILHGSNLPFHELPNVLVTPHMSAWTDAMIERRMAAVARNLDLLALGRPLERVVMLGAWKG